MTVRDRFAIGLVLFASLAIGVAGCGGSQEPGKPKRADKPAAAAAKAKADAAQDARRPANAVTADETGAALELQYEVAPRPEAGQPFVIELAFVPGLSADSIDAQLSATAGLKITSAETARFDAVQAGERYTTQAVVIGDAPGLYYVGVMARMATKVQTDDRNFSVPVVVGAPPAPAPAAAAAEPEPEVDTSGTPADSTSATATGGT